MVVSMSHSPHAPTFPHGFSTVGFTEAKGAALDAWHQPPLLAGELADVPEYCDYPAGLDPAFHADAWRLVHSATIDAASCYITSLDWFVRHSLADNDLDYSHAMRFAMSDLRSTDAPTGMWTYLVAHACSAIDLACRLFPAPQPESDDEASHQDEPDMAYLSSLLSPEDAPLAAALAYYVHEDGAAEGADAADDE